MATVTALQRAQKFLKHELYADALAALEGVAPSPQANWVRGAALGGLSHHEDALRFLREAERGLAELERAQCGLDTAFTLIRAVRLEQARQKTEECRQIFENHKEEAGLAKCDFLQLCTKQRAGNQDEFLEKYKTVANKFLALGLEDWWVITISLAVLSQE